MEDVVLWRKGPNIWAIIFIVIGICILISGPLKEMRCTIETEGTVVNISEEITRNNEKPYSERHYYYPVIEYKAGEKEITKKSNYDVGPSKYVKNQKVTILYNPKNVEEFIIKGEKHFNILAIPFIMIGIFIFIRESIKIY